MTLEKEMKTINAKDIMLDEYLEKEERKIVALNHCLSYNIAGCYLKNLKNNVFEELYHQGFYPNTL